MFRTFTCSINPRLGNDKNALRLYVTKLVTYSGYTLPASHEIEVTKFTGRSGLPDNYYIKCLFLIGKKK